MKKVWKNWLLGVGIVGMYWVFAGRGQVQELREYRRRMREVGTEEAHRGEQERLRGEARALREELKAIREAKVKVVGAGKRTAASSLNEAHRRIQDHAGARILGVFCGEAEGGERRWVVSIEAPWGAMREILSDFATEGGFVVQSVSMQPGVGPGKPMCWTLTICL